MRPRAKMTSQWEKVLKFIEAYIKLHGVSPSYKVMAKSLGLNSKSNMHRIVKRLEEEGHLRKKAFKYYSIKVVDRSVEQVVSL